MSKISEEIGAIHAQAATGSWLAKAAVQFSVLRKVRTFPADLRKAEADLLGGGRTARPGEAPGAARDQSRESTDSGTRSRSVVLVGNHRAQYYDWLRFGTSQHTGFNEHTRRHP